MGRVVHATWLRAESSQIRRPNETNVDTYGHLAVQPPSQIGYGQMFRGVIKQANNFRRRIRMLVEALIGRILARTSANNRKVPIFVVGCHRSGTTMLLNVLRRSPRVQVHEEGDRRAFGEGVRILSDNILRFLIYRSRTSHVAFKPLNDSQNADKLIELNSNARAIWIYRDYHDVVNSLVVQWGDAQKAHVEQIAGGDYAGPGSRALGEKVSASNFSFVRQACREELSPHDAAAVIWVLRNSLYFDLGLDSRPNVLLVKYEDLCTDPEHQFKNVFSFVGCELSEAYLTDVYSSSIRKHGPPVLSSDIASMCEELMRRLNEHNALKPGYHQMNVIPVQSEDWSCCDF